MRVNVTLELTRHLRDGKRVRDVDTVVYTRCSTIAKRPRCRVR